MTIDKLLRVIFAHYKQVCLKVLTVSACLTQVIILCLS
jgi:hypothetical protein